MSIEKKYMKLAIDLAASVKGNTFPNPAVGAVIVKDGEIAGTGATQPAGSDHAEIVALKEAGDKAVGADLYVTLEPCCHFGKTPPCSDAIIKAGVNRVIVANEDPNPLVDGGGIAALRGKGIEVISGVLESSASKVNEDFFYAIKNEKTWVTFKLALTLDGKIADSNNSSKWITSQAAREEVHLMRSTHAAICVGKGTYLKDDPKLNVRSVNGTSPVRIVFIQEKDINPESFFVTHAGEVRTIIVSHGGNQGEIKKRDDGIEVWSLGESTVDLQIDLFRKMAYNEGLTSVFLEGGAKLGASFMENCEVNKVVLFFGNKILGGGLDGFSFINPLQLGDSFVLEGMETKILEDNIMVTGYPAKEGCCLQG